VPAPSCTTSPLKGASRTPSLSVRSSSQPLFYLSSRLVLLPLTNRFDQNLLDLQFSDFSNAAGCSLASLACLRNLSSEQLQTANVQQTEQAPYGHFQYGPAIDGVYVQSLPGQELLNGRFANGIEILAGHNRYSGQNTI